MVKEKLPMSEAAKIRHIRRLTRDITRWCADNGEARRAKDVAAAHKWLRSSDPRASIVAAGRLRHVAHWYALHGAKVVLNGGTEEWQSIDRVLHYTWWGTRIGTEPLVTNAAHCLAHAIVFDEAQMAGWLAQRLLHSLYDGRTLGWKTSPFGVFMLELWALRTNAAPLAIDRTELADLDAYQPVIDAWHDVDALRRALLMACDYHLAQSVDGEDFGEFVWSPYDLFPVDILAVARVREQQGLPMPEIGHPLMQTPLAKPPPNDVRPRMPPDPLLEAVIEKARKQGFLPPAGKDVFAL